MNIHMNLFKGNTEEIFNRFMSVFDSLSDGVRNRLTLENEDKLNSWSVQTLYHHFKNTGIPLTFDNLHHKCNSHNIDGISAMTKCMETWPADITPMFHFSDSDGKNPRAHSDYPIELPTEYKNFNGRIDLDFEFKMKDLAIQQFQKKN